MKILCISGYPAWKKVSRLEMPSHHLYGIHEMIDHYETYDHSVRGILRKGIFDGGYVDFYLWKGGKTNLIRQTKELIKISKKYDVLYDELNRCSIYLGLFKRYGIIKAKLITIMHHPPYGIQLKISDSDAYVFFNEDYRRLAIKACSKKSNSFFVNEWRPDMEWYKSHTTEQELTGAFFIDNGKSRRDRDLLIEAANSSKIRIDYAGQKDESEGFARSYSMDLKDDIGMMGRLLKHKAVVIPVKKANKEKIGPLGITSFLDCIALSLPVIASDNVCFAEEIENNELGLVYKTGDLESLISALTKLKYDCEFYEKCVLNLKSYAKYTMKDYSEKLVEIIDGIV